MVSVEGFINHARSLLLIPSPQPLSRRERGWGEGIESVPTFNSPTTKIYGMMRYGLIYISRAEAQRGFLRVSASLREK